MRTLPIVALALALSFAAFAQPEAKEIQITTTQLSPAVAMLEGMGGNIGVFHGDDGVFLIDDQFAPMVPKIRAAVAALSQKPLRLVFNTHWHGDHTGGNEQLGEAGALIVAQDNVRKRMTVEQVMKLFARTVPPAPHKALPVVTFPERISFHLNGDDISAVHYPRAHTDGDVALYFATAKVVHTGDLFVIGGYPIIDVDSGGSARGLLEAQEKIIEATPEGAKVIPGHGPATDREGLKKTHERVKQMIERIEALVKQGKSLEQITEEKPLAEFEDLGKGFLKTDRFIGMVVRSLSEHQATDAKQAE
jgi:cyclase